MQSLQSSHDPVEISAVKYQNIFFYKSKFAQRNFLPTSFSTFMLQQ